MKIIGRSHKSSVEIVKCVACDLRAIKKLKVFSFGFVYDGCFLGRSVCFDNGKEKITKIS